MSSELTLATVLCRGKVSSSKQQLLNKFSSNHAPIQYGVDYSAIVKHDEAANKSLKSESKQPASPKQIFGQTASIPARNELKRPTIKSPVNTDQKWPSTFETVSSIKFQTSPPVKRKVILITSNKRDDHQPLKSDTYHKMTLSTKEEQQLLDLPKVLNDNEPLSQITNSVKSNLDKNSRLSKSAVNEPPHQLPESEIPDNHNNNSVSIDKNINLNSSEKNLEENSEMKSDFVDSTLISVAQRAKSIMVNRPNRSMSRNLQKNSITMKPEDEENEEPLLSIKDRIKIFKENLNNTAINTPPKTEISTKSNSNRFKTQPLSFDDIARANAMILDQNDVGSTIASPSITNSNETLVDISDDSSSSGTNNSTLKLRSIGRVQSCLLNQTSTFHKSIDEEDLSPAINVKDFVKSRDKESEVILSPKLSRNAAVSRRLAFKNKTLTEDKGILSNKVYAKRPHYTQPITKQDIEVSSMSRSDSNKSINDRISSIQLHENKWKQRVPKDANELVNARPGSLYEIQEQLQTNQTNWKSRIELKDVEQFTTQAKMQSIKIQDTSLRHSFHGSALKDDKNENICVARLVKDDKTDQPAIKFTLRSNFVSNIEENTPVTDQGIDTTYKSENRSLLVNASNQKQVHSHKVTIPQMSDQSLSNFFKSPETDPQISTGIGDKPTSDDFDDIFLQSDLTLTTQKRSVKPVRKSKNASKNPIKNLNERSDIMSEYEEITYDIADRELPRSQVEPIPRKAGFTEETLAALSSKEDFSKVKLKRTESGKMFEHFVSPYKDVMLISVKGRKKVQLRLVKPAASSINCGDCYLLVTGTQIFVWQGICANVIEINKANELGSWIAKCKDLNYKGNADKPLIVKSNDIATNTNVMKFWSSLKYEKVQQCNNPGTAEEDEIYEQRIQTTNMVFQVVGNDLIPLNEYWGRSLKYQMLADNEVYIFDFGSELYLWSGNKADYQIKMHGKALLRQLWTKGFDYECCNINPLDPLPDTSEKAEMKKGLVRPDWVIVGRLAQRGETILFKEKISDWPESSRLIKIDNSVLNSLEKKSSASDLQPLDLDEVLNVPHPNVHLTIDGKSVGRGSYWKVLEDGILREFDILTNKIDVWHIIDNDVVKVEENSMGQFCNADAYIIRWDFEIKTLGRFKRNQSTGNLSSAFFFWQGAYTTVTEKTASALHTIDLDKDKVTQIRVKQHDESPAFCRLFDGSMIIHQGKRKNVQKNVSVMRLFIIRGEVKGEAHFVEVQCLPDSLRTRSSFLLLNTLTGKGYLWFGRLSSEQSKLCAQYCVQSLNKKKPAELGLNSKTDIKVEEIKQGDEHRLFWQEIGAIKRWRSWNLSVKLEPIRGWLVSGVTNSFELNELKYSLNPDPDDESIASFPLVQSSLYKASQPALFIIWNRSRLYLWQGWWPHLTKSTTSESDIDIEADEADHDWAMPKNRIAAEKLASLKSLDSYLMKHTPEEVSASIIYAGLEPLAFQELFPFWEVNETVKTANIKKGYQMFQEDDIPQTLNKYLTEKFSVSRLQMRPLPECVVLSKIEWYLPDQEFEDLFKMSKEEFYEMTNWKQREKKKEVNLF